MKEKKTNSKKLTKEEVSPIKEELKPIDIKAQQDLDRLTEKYKEQKKEDLKENIKIEPPIQNFDPQQIEQEVELLNQIYMQSFKRNLPPPAMLSYRMGSLSYQKRKGKSPLELLDRYPMIYFAAFGLCIVNDIIQNLPKKNPGSSEKNGSSNSKNKDFESRKSQKEKSSDQVDIIGEVKPIKLKFFDYKLLMEKLSDHRFEKRLKKVAKIINSDRFYFYYEGDSLSFYDEYIKIIKIITNKRAINEDRDWANDRLIILDHISMHFAKAIESRINRRRQN